MPRILAFDLATRTGYAHDGPRAGVPIAGIIEAERPLGDKQKGLERGITFHTFRRQAITLIDQVKPAIIVYEAPLNVLLAQRGSANRKKPFRTNMETVIALCGFTGQIEELCYALHIPCFQVTNQEFKKWFAGTAGGGKDPVKLRCKQLGWEVFGDDNAADACGIWAYAKMLKDPRWAPETTPLLSRAKR
jgi:hypothetical protein